MTAEISERTFEEAIECALLQYGPGLPAEALAKACAGDAMVVRETSPPYGDSPPGLPAEASAQAGGYRKRRPEDYGRCPAHFAVDPDLVYVTTHLQGAKTRFLPFNRGKFGGAGNPPVPPTRKGFATAYLWEATRARDSVLDLVRQFIHEVEEEEPPSPGREDRPALPYLPLF